MDRGIEQILVQTTLFHREIALFQKKYIDYKHTWKYLGGWENKELPLEKLT